MDKNIFELLVKYNKEVHKTHHRGMISLYLEFLGKENDYSNLYPYE
jgi:hypothetical protein